MSIRAINPATGELLQKYDEMPAAKVEQTLKKVQKAFEAWQATSFSERATLMRKAAQDLRTNKTTYAELITKEMGKPIASAEKEVEKCAWVCDYYATSAEGFLSPESVKTDSKKSYVAFEPLGVVLAVMPWNYPLWQAFRFAAPALMAGNAAVLKHASNVPGCALAIEAVFRNAGFPEHLFRTLLINSKKVNKIIENPIVKAVTLTGSGPAGSAVASKAASLLKKSVLELGGNDAYVVLEDADLHLAANACVASRLKNSGQTCIAAKRFIVVQPILQEFTTLCLEYMQNYQMGNPMERSFQIGPLARYDLRDELDKQVQKSIKLGAKCLMGGSIPTQKEFAQGAYYPPTLLTHVKKGMPAYHEELFGPVASIISAKNQQEAIKIANDTIFGLTGAVFSQDTKKAEEIAHKQIQSGTCFVNSQAFSDPRLPFGGIKASGYGRELSHYGIREFVNIKTICIP